MMSISDFEYTNGFVFQNTNNWMYNTPLYLQNLKSGIWHPSGTLPAFGGRSLLLRLISGTPNGSNLFPLTILLGAQRYQWTLKNVQMSLLFKINTIWYITFLSFFKIKEVGFGIYQEHFLTLEDVPDSWDKDQKPQMVPMWSPWP